MKEDGSREGEKMPKPWDEGLRSMIRENPQAFIELFLSQGDVEYRGQLPEKLRTWNLEVDALVKVQAESGEEMLIHFEFQTKKDSAMPERLLQYNVLARGEYKLPVLSCVFYLRRDGNVKPSPLCWMVPLNAYEMLKFHYVVIEIAKFSAEDIRNMGQAALLPFLPLTKDGATEDVIGEMLDELIEHDNTELAKVGLKFSWLVFEQTDPTKMDWLKRRYAKMFDLLYEDEIYRDIFTEGKKEGKKEGIEEGVIQALRGTIIDVVSIRFPQLEELARKQVMVSEDENALRTLNIKIVIAQNADEAEQLLRLLSATKPIH
jgi:predicted transposase YdaD